MPMISDLQPQGTGHTSSLPPSYLINWHRPGSFQHGMKQLCPSRAQDFAQGNQSPLLMLVMLYRSEMPVVNAEILGGYICFKGGV